MISKRLLKTLVAVAFIIPMCSTLVSSQVGRRPVAKAAGNSCDACHSTESITVATSKYFEHYKTVHREVVRRKLSCNTCHTPFANELKGVVRSAACSTCHDAEKRGQRLNAASAHSIHLSQSGVSCSSCHQAVKHKLDMTQLLNVCSNCH
jgi:nitrate/TMAO reductase-like tetraheme cytochrome c subunit